MKTTIYAIMFLLLIGLVNASLESVPYDDCQTDNLATKWTNAGWNSFYFDTDHYQSGPTTGGDTSYVMQRNTGTNIRGFNAQVKFDPLSNYPSFMVGDGTISYMYSGWIQNGYAWAMYGLIYNGAYVDTSAPLYIYNDAQYHNFTMYIDEENILKLIADGNLVLSWNTTTEYIPNENTTYALWANTYSCPWCLTAYVKDVNDIRVAEEVPEVVVEEERKSGTSARTRALITAYAIQQQEAQSDNLTTRQAIVISIVAIAVIIGGVALLQGKKRGRR